MQFFLNNNQKALNKENLSRAELIEELNSLSSKNQELENLLIECKRAIDANKDVKYLYDVAQDLIELKRAEEELKKERDYFKNVLDNSADAVGIVDSNGRFIRWNKRAEELFGYSFEELEGKSAFDLYADKQDLNSMLKELRENGYVRDYEISIKRKDGQIIPFGMSISVLKEKDMNIGSVCVARDLSQIKQVQAALQKSKEDAEKANKAKSEFLANMSHEIRTPMNAILGFSEALLNKSSDEEHRQYLNTILSSGRTLLSLIDDILDLSKIEAGRLDIEPEFINLPRLLDDIYAIFQPRFEEKQIDFSIDLDPELSETLLLDEVRIRQILINLVGNALKFTPSGYVVVEVYARNIYPESFELDLVLEVRDTGIGIPKSQQELVFENFRQRDNQYTRQFGGSGLGLSIIKRLVDLMNGEISLDSETDKGTRFRILLNRVQTGEEVKTRTDDIFREIVLDPGEILVVDDVKENVDLIEAYLEDSMIRVLGAGSVQEAREKLENNNPELVLMDLQMLDENGYEAASSIKQKFPDISIIAFTATVMKQEIECIQEYFESYISKPVQKEVLIRELEKYLSCRKYSREVCEAGNLSISQMDSESSAEEPCPDDLRSVLKKDFEPRWRELKDVLIIEDLERFALDLKKSGEHYHYFAIKDLGGRLYESVQSYDIEGVKKVLAQFPKFLDFNSSSGNCQG